FGAFGWLCARLGIPTIPLILGMVMGDTLEASLRQTLRANDGSLMVFLTRPMSAVMVAIAVLLLAWPLLRRLTRLLFARPTSTEQEPS
ncbi:MAG: hypothetical protein IT509_12760, partial [Rhodocyclaceae bacterium]|nr:hypothetical protein [Rhodocyclaceae bacterium]